MEATEAFQAAEDYVRKSAKGMAKGSLWWIERKIREDKTRLPMAKGGISKNAYWAQ